MREASRRIAIIAPYTTLPTEPKSNRFRTLARMLAAENDVCLVTSKFDHTSKSNRSGELRGPSSHGYSICLLWEPGYRQNVSLSRVFSHFLFLVSLFFWLVVRGRRYDGFVCAAPFSSSTIMCKVLCKGRVIIDVQDIWPEAFTMLQPSGWKKTLIDSTKCISVKALKLADFIVTVSDDFSRRSKTLSSRERAETIHIGSDILPHQRREKSPSIENADVIKLVYIGTIGHSYQVDLVADAIVRGQWRRQWQLIVIGDGPLLPELVSRYDGQCEIIFKGAQRFDEMVRIVNECHFGVNPIVPDSAASVTNKVSDYFAIGIPFISGQNNGEVIDLVSRVSPYLCYEPGRIESIVQVLKRIEDLPDIEYFDMVHRTLEIGESLFLREHSYLKYVELVNKL